VSQPTGPMTGAMVLDQPRPPRHPSPDVLGGGPDDAGPRRWRRWVLLVAVATGVLALLLLVVPTSLVDPLTRRAVSGYGGSCADLLGVDVDSGTWPVVARAAAGEHRDVATQVDELRIGGFSYYDVRFSAERVEVAPLFGLLGDRSTQVHGGASAATVRFHDVEEAVAAYGVTAQLRGEGSTLIADVEVPFVGPVPTTVEITPLEDDMQLVFAPLDLVELPPVRIPFPAPAAFRSVDVEGDALRIHATVDGHLRSGAFGCDTASNPPG
jgi:hypothetical protein